MRCGAIPLMLGALLAAVAGCGGGSETYAVEPTEACLRAKGVTTWWEDKPEPGASGPFSATQGSLFAQGVVPVHVLFGADAGEAEAWAEGLEDYQYPEVDGRQYRMVVRRRGNAVLGARVPVEEEFYDPPSDEVREALDAAEHCLRGEAPGNA